MAFVKAAREKVKLRVGLIGPSGSGKTYSALRLATGIAKGMGGGKIALIDTEGGRGKYYATEFDYEYAQLDPPFTPERYIDIIKEAVNGGFSVLIIDSISHEWIGTGGLLQVHSAMPGNSYTNWRMITPRHDRFLDTIVRAPMHVIVTMRGKDEYVLTENQKGKQEPKKVGVGAQQRDGFEYECTCSLIVDIEQHVAIPMKDNTHVFDNFVGILTEEVGWQLQRWSESGKEAEKVTAAPASAPQAAVQAQVAPTLEQTALFPDEPEVDRASMLSVLTSFFEKESSEADAFFVAKRMLSPGHTIPDLSDENLQRAYDHFDELKKVYKAWKLKRENDRKQAPVSAAA